MNREERRRLQAASRAAHPTGAAPRPVDELVFSHAPKLPIVLVGLAGDGYVRLDYDQARERAMWLLTLAGVNEKTVDVIRALLP